MPGDLPRLPAAKPAGRPSPINPWFSGCGRFKSHPRGFHVRIDANSVPTRSDRPQSAATVRRFFADLGLRLRRRAVLVAADDGRRAKMDDGGGIQRGLCALQFLARAEHREFLGRVRAAGGRHGRRAGGLAGVARSALPAGDVARPALRLLWRHRGLATRLSRGRGGRRRPHHQHRAQDGRAAAARAPGLCPCFGAGRFPGGRDPELADLLGAGRADPLRHRGGVVAAPMNSEIGTLLTLAGYFALLSLFAIGGANAALPEMHRLAVEVMHWMNDRQFADMYAIAQVTPGPNVVVVALIGYHVAGLLGAVVATLAMCGPTCVFAFFIGRVWDRFKDAPWRLVIQAALVPVSIGLIGASAAVIVRAAAQSWVAVAVSVVTAVVTYTIRVNPLWIFAGAAVLGLVGLM